LKNQDRRSQTAATAAVVTQTLEARCDEQKVSSMYEHSIPVIPSESRSILDVGCGDGESLRDAHFPAGSLSVGVDINLRSLKECRRKLPSSHFVLVSGEQLGFCNESFDAYISRVSWPYTHIPPTAKEAYRVLKPGGYLWVKLHPFGFVLSHCLASARSLNFKDAAFRAYVILNGVAFHCTGKNYRFPLNRKRCESFQTVRSIRRALIQAGFRDVQITQGASFLATARK